MSHTVFLLAAGFGTRLRPLTLHRPKPLLPLLGRPMVDYSLALLQEQGHRKIVVNAHHLWEHIARWTEKNQLSLQVEQPDILGTGGGLKAAEERLAEKFVIWNGDIVSDIDTRALLDACPEDGACMALRYSTALGKTTPLQRSTDGMVLRIGSVCAHPNAPAPVVGSDGYHFTGIHAMSRHTLREVPPNSFQCIVRSAYKQLVPSGAVQSILHDGVWFDTGLPQEYWEANMQALRGELILSIDPWEEANPRYDNNWVHRNAEVAGTIHSCVIGAQAVVPARTVLDQCIVWDSVVVPEGEYSRCIFHEGGCLSLEER
ncbi:MAG: sugar phosphate nucleotidyltransferase [Myxococcota bacterium]|nr:sugar phosphate nucleotidyltransferase [Myxococcota bacterium]